MTAEWLVPTLVYILAAGGLGVTSKLALRDLRWPDLILWTGVGYVLVGIGMLLLGQTEVEFVSGTAWAALTAAAAITSLLAFFLALSRGAAGTVVPVSAAYPAVTLILAAIFLSEALTVAKAAGVVLVVGGVIVLTSSRSDRGPSSSAGAGGPTATTAGWLTPTMVYVLGVGGIGITSKLALEHLEWQDLILWSGLGYALVVTALLARGSVKAQLVRGTGWAVLSAVVAVGGLIALYIALSTGAGQASKVVPISAAYPAVTLILSALLLGERLTVARGLGVVLVIGGVVVLTTA